MYKPSSIKRDAAYTDCYLLAIIILYLSQIYNIFANELLLLPGMVGQKGLKGPSRFFEAPVYG